MIMASGTLDTKGGFLYLTDELFGTGSEAARFLAIPVTGPSMASASGLVNLTKPVEVVCCIPAPLVDAALLQGPEDVDPFRDWATGNILYAGGGRQFRFSGRIDVAGLAWLTLGKP
jgi:hypothetical protein